MPKDHIRDYATAAFRFYARWGGRQNYLDNLFADITRHKGSGIGSPTETEMIKREQLLKERYAEIADMTAVETVFHILDVHRPEIRKAIEMVYMHNPFVDLEWGDIKKRVKYAAHTIPASERQIYRWLWRARRLFAEERGIRMWDNHENGHQKKMEGDE